MHPPSHPTLNQSLIKGIAILRAFRPGTSSLGNGEIAKRTGIPRSTVTRLTQTLVLCGYLIVDTNLHEYRLGPGVLSLSHSMKMSSPIIQIASPLMQQLANQSDVNVGLAAPDLYEMVYLTSFRSSNLPSIRTVVAGRRVPMELTSLGRAYLAALSTSKRNAYLDYFCDNEQSSILNLRLELENAVNSVVLSGFCAAAWQPQLVAVACPIVTPTGIYAINVTVSTKESIAEKQKELGPVALKLKRRIDKELRSALTFLTSIH